MALYVATVNGEVVAVADLTEGEARAVREYAANARGASMVTFVLTGPEEPMTDVFSVEATIESAIDSWLP